MDKGLYICIFFIGSTIYASTVFAQAKQDKYGNEYFSEGIVTSPTPVVPSNPNMQLQPLVLLKYDNKDLLTGNACVKEETLKMGFEYLVLCKKDVTFWNKVWIFMYNLGTKTELTFKNGPGWQRRLHKKVVECKRNSGDFIW